MLPICWKKVEAEVKHLYMLPLYTLLVTCNLQIIIGEMQNKPTNKQIKHLHGYKIYSHINISTHTVTHGHIHTLDERIAFI